MAKLHYKSPYGSAYCGTVAWNLLTVTNKSIVTCLKCQKKLGYHTPKQYYNKMMKKTSAEMYASDEVMYSYNDTFSPGKEAALYDYAHARSFDTSKDSVKMIEEDMSEAAKKVNSIFNLESGIKERNKQNKEIGKLLDIKRKLQPKPKWGPMACSKSCKICKERGYKYSGYN